MPRCLLTLVTAFLVLVATPALARTIIDLAGRSVDVPDRISRVFTAGPPASVLLAPLSPANEPVVAGGQRAVTLKDSAHGEPVRTGQRTPLRTRRS